VSFLDYPDAALDKVDATDATRKIARHVARVKPHVVITFGPEGAHCDRITSPSRSWPPRPRRRGAGACVSKFYYLEWSQQKWAAYQTALKNLSFTVEASSVASPWPDWALTTIIDTSQVWPTVARRVVPQDADEHHRISNTSRMTTTPPSGARRSSTARSAS
jgi:LmbE family N-acetylglucosaminyl deacetylase